MVWVTRPQHRAALAGVAALLGALALYVVSVGVQVHHAWPTCHTGSTPRQGTSSVPGSSGRDPRAAHRPRHRHLRPAGPPGSCHSALPPVSRSAGRARRAPAACFFRTRTGCPWRDLPEGFGNWKTVYNRHRRWSGDGTWEEILDRLRAGCDEAEGEDWTVSADSAVVRAHH
jgi:transposase